MKASSEELEVVRDRDECTRNDEEEEPEARSERDADADRSCACERQDREAEERPSPDAGLQRTSVQLVERMRGNPHPEEEGDQRETEDPGAEMGRERRADRHIGEMPQGVGRVQQGDVVAPAAGCERVKRRPDGAAHSRSPQVTIPPPRLRLRDLTCSMPASTQSSSRRSSGQRS